jgi:predicted CXXCH cytochrome family protein
MQAFVTVCLLGPAGVGAQALPTSEACRDCHLRLEDERLAEPARAYELDVHAEAGFGCLACHGSGGRDELDPAVGFLSVPQRRNIPAMCGSCHSDAEFMRQFNPSLRVDQVTEYWTSVHGQLLSEHNDPDVATCIDCHTAHSIRPPSDPASTTYPLNVVQTCGSCHASEEVMGDRDRSTRQVSDYSVSVHGRLLFEEGDVSAPVCNDCHGNHGATPPGVSSVRNVCGQCHSVMADYFDESGHARIFEEEDVAGCATCHGHHTIERTTDEFLLYRSEGVCFACHEEGDTLGAAFERIYVVLDSLGVAADAGRRRLEEAENLGMEVSQALFELEEVSTVQTRARSAVHTFHVEPVREEVQNGLDIAAGAVERGTAAMREYRIRRIGLGMFAGVVLLLIVGLTLKIRELEERVG